MKKEGMQISAATHPNGYELTVNGESYMYFSAVEWLAGAMAHIGMCETTSMEKGTILSTLFSAMMGNAYADAITTLKQRVGLLTSQYTTTIERMDKAIDYVTQAEKTVAGFMRRLENIETQIKSTELDHADNKKVVDEVKKVVSRLQKETEEMTNSLANSATILKAIDSAASKKTEKPEIEEKPKGKGKGRGGRNKAADELVMNELKKKAENNPNIK